MKFIREKFLNWFYPRRKFLDYIFSMIGFVSLLVTFRFFSGFIADLILFCWFVVFHLIPQGGLIVFLELVCERDGLTGNK